MTEEQAKKQDAKQEPVKEELTDEELEEVSGGAKRDFVPREEKFDDCVPCKIVSLAPEVI
mgnify:CR=1 FL=1